MTAPHDSAPQFWQWSINIYNTKGVSTSLLKLQDEIGLNVNILLWCLWSGNHFEDIPELVLRKGCDVTYRWSEEIIKNIRSARRLSKAPPRQADLELVQKFRRNIKAVELEAERIEQMVLEQLSLENLVPSNNTDDRCSRARRNLANYAALVSAVKNNSFHVGMLEDLVHHVYSNASSTSQET